MDILTTLLGKALFSILNFLFRKPLEGLGRWFFEEAYRISSLHRNHRQLRYLWDDQLGEDLSYHINWHKLFLGKEQKQCTLWIKASRRGEFKKLTVRVDARLDNLRCQSVKTIYDVTQVPTVVALPDIPLRELKIQKRLAVSAV